MRLHQLDFTGVGPFLTPQHIDFDDLSVSGLFLIDGATGTGKTTIIDAIVYALFGDVSGGSDSDSGRMRSSYCTDTDPTGVTLEFTVDRRRHRIHRVPAGARDPREPGRAATSRPSRQVLTEFDADGRESLVLVKAGDIRQHVESLLAMNSEQFRQLVVLPQGRFADLLRMSPSERLTALASLLDHNEFFRRVQDDLKVQGLRAEDQRRAARDAANRAAQQLAGRLRGYLEGLEPAPEVDFADPAARDDDRLAAADAALADLAARAEDAEAERARQSVVAEEARTIAARERSVARALGEVGQAQADVTQAVAALDPLDAGVAPAAIATLVGDLKVHEGSLGGHARWEADSDDRAADRAELAAKLERYRADAAALREQQADLPTRRAALEQQRGQAQQLAGTLAAASSEAARLADLVLKADEATELTPRLAELAADVAAAESAEAGALALAEEAHAAWVALLDQQRVDQAAALATALAEGVPCPVCGSPKHPHPALPPEGHALVTDAEVTAAKDAHDRAAADARARAAELVTARAAWHEADTRRSVLLGALGDATPDSIRTAHHEAVGRVDRAAAAEEALAALAAQTEELERAASTLDDQISTAEVEAGHVAGAVSERDAAEAARRDEIRAAIGTAESATALLASTRARIDALTALQQAQARLDLAGAAVPAGQREIPVADAEARAATAEAASAASEADLEAITATTTTLTVTVNEATPLRQSFASALVERRSVDDRTAGAISLAALATGANTRKLPLRSYALQRRFESVLAAASVHLVRMSSGKFSFELSQQVGAGHSGLGIMVHDAWTGHTQEPKSLSGGETFYAALSLALGLADVVRGEAGGSALETLFIDEGFGSLDQETLYQVLDQLDLMRAGGRVIGVISHVTEMKESIPDRLDVRRGEDSTSTVSRPGA